MAFSAVDAASAILTLSKAAWKLGSSFSRLDHTTIADTTVKNLAEDVRSLSNECDLVHAELEEVVRKSETAPHPPDDVEDRVWNCLATQVEETSRTIQELELFVASIRQEESRLTVHAQSPRKQDKSREQIATIRTSICRRAYNLHATLLLINTVFSNFAPYRADQRLPNQLDKLQDMVEELQRLSETHAQSRASHTEATLVQCAREVIAKGATMSEASLATASMAEGQPAVNRNIRVAEWVSTLESIRRDQRLSDASSKAPTVPSVFSEEETRTVVTTPISAQHTVLERDAVDAEADGSDDDLDTDLAKAALDTGTKAFEAQEWEEADSLLQEALRLLQQLPNQRRAFCDIFGLQYKLALCAYHTREPADAEEALMSLVQQSAVSDKQRGYIWDAAHLLSHLYLRMGQLDRARSHCEKALHARRRLLGKHSDASLESTALMAHIYFLLNNGARAKAYLAMIPETRRDGVLRIVEESLGTKVEHSDPSPLLTRSLTRSIPEHSTLAERHIQSRFSAPSPALSTEDQYYRPASAMLSHSPAGSPRRSHQRIPSSTAGLEDLRPVTLTPMPSAEERSESRATNRESASENDRALEKARVMEKHYAPYPETLITAPPPPAEPPEAGDTPKVKTLSRKEILEKIGCQPKDRIEEAVCESDHTALTNLLGRKKDFWRSRLRKRGRPERVTALHFAALFGEIDMARRLLGSNFNINEVPYGYTTNLTPLKFAIGARQVEMVNFLIANGAMPSEPDSWSTLAGQLMNRSWLQKTMSDAEKDDVPNRIVAILGILLKHGWDVNAPFEASGKTVLEQAVTFWTGSYRWDLDLRAAVTLFLCERGADPFQANAEGKTPYDMAVASGHQDLLRILDRYSKEPEPEPAELPAN